MLLEQLQGLPNALLRLARPVPRECKFREVTGRRAAHPVVAGGLSVAADCARQCPGLIEPAGLKCATAACVVFAVLGSSTLPVLRSIGITVVLGVVCNFLLSQLLIRRQR